MEPNVPYPSGQVASQSMQVPPIAAHELSGRQHFASLPPGHPREDQSNVPSAQSSVRRVQVPPSSLHLQLVQKLSTHAWVALQSPSSTQGIGLVSISSQLVRKKTLPRVNRLMKQIATLSFLIVLLLRITYL
jgi:hypothetical protein